jgi:hypothetical protein
MPTLYGLKFNQRLNGFNLLSIFTCLQLYRSMRAFVADTIYLAGEVLLHDKGLVLVPQVRHRVVLFPVTISSRAWCWCYDCSGTFSYTFFVVSNAACTVMIWTRDIGSTTGHLQYSSTLLSDVFPSIFSDWGHACSLMSDMHVDINQQLCS